MSSFRAVLLSCCLKGSGLSGCSDEHRISLLFDDIMFTRLICCKWQALVRHVCLTQRAGDKPHGNSGVLYISKIFRDLRYAGTFVPLGYPLQG